MSKWFHYPNEISAWMYNYPTHKSKEHGPIHKVVEAANARGEEQGPEADDKRGSRKTSGTYLRDDRRVDKHRNYDRHWNTGMSRDVLAERNPESRWADWDRKLQNKRGSEDAVVADGWREEEEAGEQVENGSECARRCVSTNTCTSTHTHTGAVETDLVYWSPPQSCRAVGEHGIT